MLSKFQHIPFGNTVHVNWVQASSEQSFPTCSQNLWNTNTDLSDHEPLSQNFEFASICSASHFGSSLPITSQNDEMFFEACDSCKDLSKDKMFSKPYGSSSGLKSDSMLNGSFVSRKDLIEDDSWNDRLLHEPHTFHVDHKRDTCEQKGELSCEPHIVHTIAAPNLHGTSRISMFSAEHRTILKTDYASPSDFGSITSLVNSTDLSEGVMYIDKESKNSRVEEYPAVNSVALSRETENKQPRSNSERPRTPFSKKNVVVLYKFTQGVDSPFASNFSPIFPFIYRSELPSMTPEEIQKLLPTELTLRTCYQIHPIPLKLVVDNLQRIEKIGEGVYGEAYLGYFGNSPQPRVYKIVAVEGTKEVNGEKQKGFDEVLPEIIMSQELSKLREGLNGCCTQGFVKLHSARVCKGKYPSALIKCWKSWHKDHRSDNDCPDFDSGQIYVVFESQFAGIDVQSFKFKNSKQSFSVIMQVAHIFATGEYALEFEHRDAHWGNILVESTSAESVIFVFNGSTYQVPTWGVKVTIIDFTMSRVKDENGKAVYVNLTNDEEQFVGTGDFQFDIYRMTRDHNNDDWCKFSPKSNIFWIHYLTDKMHSKGRYLDTISVEHLTYIRHLNKIKKLIVGYKSCVDFVQSYLCQLYRGMEPDDKQIILLS